jgi:hypothetical protein
VWQGETQHRFYFGALRRDVAGPDAGVVVDFGVEFVRIGFCPEPPEEITDGRCAAGFGGMAESALRECVVDFADVRST